MTLPLLYVHGLTLSQAKKQYCLCSRKLSNLAVFVSVFYHLNSFTLYFCSLCINFFHQKHSLSRLINPLTFPDDEKQRVRNVYHVAPSFSA